MRNLFLLFFILASAAKAGGLFVLHSHPMCHLDTSSQHKAFLQTLHAKANTLTRIDIESLHVQNRPLTPQEEQAKFEALKAKYPNLTPKAIYATNIHAVRFLHKYRTKLFANNPSVFYSNVARHALPKLDTQNFKGVVYEDVLLENIQLIQTLWPHKQKVHVVGDNSVEFLNQVRNLKEHIDELAGITLNIISYDRLDDVLALIAHDKKTPVLLVHTQNWMYNSYTQSSLNQAIKSITQLHPKVFATQLPHVSHDIVGGLVVHSAAQAAQAARLVLDYLNGTTLTQTKNTNRWIFNTQALKALKVSLPPDIDNKAAFINGTTQGFLQQYSTLLWTVLTLLLLALVYLGAYSLRTKRTKYRLQHQIHSLEEAIEHANQTPQAGLWHWDLQTNNIHLSQQAFEMLGLTPATDIVEYDTFMRHIHAKDLEKVQSALEHALSDPQYVLDITYRVATIDKTSKEVALHAEVVYDNNTPTVLFATVHDISSHNTLYEQNHLQLEILNTLEDSVYVVNEAMQLIYFNQKASQTLQYLPHELKALTLKDIDKNAHILMNTFTSNSAHLTLKSSAKHTRKDGTQFDVEIFTKLVILNHTQYIIIIAHDITQRKKTEHALEQSEQKYRNLVEDSFAGIYQTNLEGDILYVNQAVVDIFKAKSTQEVLNTSLLSHYKFPNERLEFIEELKEKGVVKSKEISMYALDWSQIKVLISAQLQKDGSISGMVLDITAQQEAIKETERLAKVLDQIDDLVMITDAYGTIYYVNDAFCKHTGYDNLEVIGSNPSILQSGEHTKSFYASMWETLIKGHAVNVQITNRKKDGSLYYEQKTITPIKDEKGEIKSFVSTAKDITEHIMLNQELEKLANTDGLTGIHNRASFDTLYKQEFLRSKRSLEPLALLLIDIDFFKEVNDTHGHDVGDTVLVELANLVKSTIRQSDIFGRWGGEEFVLLLPNTKPEGAVSFAEMLRQRIEAHTFKKVENITVSIGISILQEKDSYSEHFKRADEALYEAKEKGRNSCVLFDA